MKSIIIVADVRVYYIMHYTYRAQELRRVLTITSMMRKSMRSEERETRRRRRLEVMTAVINSCRRL